MSWNRLDSTEGSVSILLLTCIPCSELPQFQHSISNTQKTYADSGHKHVPPCWEIKKIKKRKRKKRGKKREEREKKYPDEGFVQRVHLKIDLCNSKVIRIDGEKEKWWGLSEK